MPHATNAAFNTSGITFLLPASEPLAIRALADRVLVEVFVGGGRGVVSRPCSPGERPHAGGRVRHQLGRCALTLASSAAWAMGCGWARYVTWLGRGGTQTPTAVAKNSATSDSCINK